VTTAFTDVRLKRFLEMRGSDVGSPAMIVAQPALWVGLLYDDAAQKAAAALIRDWSLEEIRALRAAGLPYSSRHGARPSSHRDVSPLGQVPVLLIDGRAIADSTAILAALAALHPTPAWAAVDPRTHAEGLLWEELADTGLNGFLVAARWAHVRWKFGAARC